MFVQPDVVCKRRATLKQMFFGKGFSKSKQKRTSEMEEFCTLVF